MHKPPALGDSVCFGANVTQPNAVVTLLHFDDDKNLSEVTIVRTLMKHMHTQQTLLIASYNFHTYDYEGDFWRIY